MPEIVPLPAGYAAWLAGLKGRIHDAQQRAVVAVNRELVLLYWQIGRDILARQEREGWGAKVIERLAQDLRNAFPDIRGFSPRNLKYMRAVAEIWPDSEFVQQTAAQLPWEPGLQPVQGLRRGGELSAAYRQSIGNQAARGSMTAHACAETPFPNGGDWSNRLLDNLPDSNCASASCTISVIRVVQQPAAQFRPYHAMLSFSWCRARSWGCLFRKPPTSHLAAQVSAHARNAGSRKAPRWVLGGTTAE